VVVVGGTGLKTVRRTDVGLAPEVLQPLGELDLVTVDLLPACLSDIVRDVQQPLVSALAELFGKQDAALLERLADGG
jgi:hypothetical protein